MKTVGIIAEYNPFHTGHAWQIARTRELLGADTAVVAVMSGNWVQGASPACADKWCRARLALQGGADLVLELPTVWAVSSAESFGFGGASILNDTGVVTDLCFGSECGDADALSDIAACLDSEAYRTALRRQLDKGLPFAVCRQAAVTELLGEKGALLENPNNNLGIEYIRALRRLNSSIRPMTVPRQVSAHNAPAEQGDVFASATHIRSLLAAKDWEQAQRWLLHGSAEELQAANRPLSREMTERMVLARLRVMAAEDWAKLPDSGAEEGLPERMVKAAGQAASLEEFFTLAKSKRYTHARLRRLALWAFLGLTEADRPEKPPYLRVLGMNRRGRELLREMKEKASLPVITKPAHARKLDEAEQKLFLLESRCTDLYDLHCRQIVPAGREWRETPVLEGIASR